MAKILLVIACALLLVIGANSSCQRFRTKCDPDVPAADQMPAAFSTKCYDCTCNPASNTITCCMNIPIPVGYNTRRCVSTFDEDTCQFRVTKKNNPRRECAVNAWTG